MSSAKPGTETPPVPKRILLTGPNGFVGSRIARCAPCLPCPSLRSAGLDEIREIINIAQPDLIIHTAAISDIGTCERDPAASYRANVLLPELLAKASGGVSLLVYSTDQVYSGNANSGPFREDEPVFPKNTYARHKAEMEQRVLDITPSAVLLRATWMYDFPLYQHANRGNFLVNTLKALLSGQVLQYSSREFRGITYVNQAAELTLKAATLPGGIYNFGSENSLSMRDTARALLKALNSNGTVEEEAPKANLWMDGSKLAAYGLHFDTTEEGFRHCLMDYGFEPLI